MKRRKQQVSYGQESATMNRRSLMQTLVTAGGAAAITSLLRPQSSALASHAGTDIPHIWDVVTHFGAKGDGQTDDTQAIQSGINHIPGGIIFFPPGVYKVSQTLLIKDKPIILCGAGMDEENGQPLLGSGASTIRYEGAGDAIVFEEVPPTVIAGAGVRDLKIQGMGASSTGAGLTLRNTIANFVERVFIQGFAGPGGVGLRLEGITVGTEVAPPQDNYLAHVLLAECDVGLEVVHAIQTTAVNLMVNQNKTGGAKFKTANVFRWIGGLVQGGSDNPQIPCAEYGVLFEPPGNGAIYGVTLDGLHFELGVKTFVKVEASADPNAPVGVTNLTIQNNHLSRCCGCPSATYFDLKGVLGLMILNNHFVPDYTKDTLLRLREPVVGAVVGLNDINFNFKQNPDIINLLGDVEVLWLGGAQASPADSGIGIGTSLPPTDHKLAVGGRAAFATVRKGVIPAGSGAVFQPDPHVGPNSHIMVTLAADPGKNVAVSFVENQHNAPPPGPGFTVFLTAPVIADTPFTYFIVDPP